MGIEEVFVIIVTKDDLLIGGTEDVVSSPLDHYPSLEEIEKCMRSFTYAKVYHSRVEKRYVWRKK